MSINTRNNHPRAETVLAVPLTTSAHKDYFPTHMLLEPGQTGLRERQLARAEDVTVIRKTSLNAPRERLRTLTSHQVCDLARMVEIAMGCAADEAIR